MVNLRVKTQRKVVNQWKQQGDDQNLRTWGGSKTVLLAPSLSLSSQASVFIRQVEPAYWNLMQPMALHAHAHSASDLTPSLLAALS